MSNPGIIAFVGAVVFGLIVETGFSANNPVFDFLTGQGGRQARLTWQSETDCSYLIEKSMDLGPGSNWSQIASLPGTGAQMAWVDPAALRVKVFYLVGRSSTLTEVAGPWQRFVMGGQTENSHGATGAMFWHLNSLKTVAAGTNVRFVARIRTIDPIRAIGISNVQSEINNRSGMFISTGFGSTNNYPLDLAPFNQLFIGPITEVQSSSTVNIWFIPAGNGTVDITQCGVISVP